MKDDQPAGSGPDEPDDTDRERDTAQREVSPRWRHRSAIEAARALHHPHLA